MFDRYPGKVEALASTVVAAIALAGCGGNGNESESTRTQRVFTAGVLCEAGHQPFVPSTEAIPGAGWAEIDVACTDGSDVKRPLAVTTGVNQDRATGKISVSLEAGDGAEMRIQDSNVRTPEGDELTVRKLSFIEIDQLDSVAISPVGAED